MLTTLAFLLDPARLGTAVFYPLTADFGHAWSLLPRTRDNDTSKPVRPAYAGLATALMAVTNQPIVIMPDVLERPEDDLAVPAVLVTTEPIPSRLIARAVGSWERHVRNGADDNTLAPLLTDADVIERELGSFLRNADIGRPCAPQWFYRVAAWNFAAELARVPLRLPASEGARGKRLDWLMDTNGSLLAWDHVLKGTTERPARTGYAMHKLDFRVITLPGEPRIAIHVLPTFSRLASHWASTRTAFVARGKDTVLRLPVGHRRNTANDTWTPYVRNFAAQVVASCNLEAIELGTNDDLAALSGPVRTLVPGPTEFPLGKGTGTRFNLCLANHIKATLGHGVHQVAYERTESELTRTAEGRITRDDLDDALGSTGHDRVRIFGLYADEYTRERMTAGLSVYLENPQDAAEWQNEHDYPVSERLVIQLRHVPSLVTQTRVDWAHELGFLKQLEPGTLTGVWVETVWNPRRQTPRRAQAKEIYDPKRDLRRHFHQNGIVSQFIAQKPRPKPRTENPDDEQRGTSDELTAAVEHEQAESLALVFSDGGSPDEHGPADENGKKERKARPKHDYPAINGLRDLFLRLGAMDRRLVPQVQLSRPAILVGLHLRQQRVSTRTIGSAEKTQMVEVITALHTHPDPGQPWQMQMYDRHSHSWLPLPQGEARFGAGPIGVDGHARHEKGAENVRLHIAAALRTLPADTPLIIFVDTEACRTIWPGLQHAKLADGPLPGLDLPGDRSVAVVSINTSYGEVPTPVDRSDARRRDQHKPAPPDQFLYRRTTGTGVTSWYLAQTSRTYNGFGQTQINGSRHTRFTIPPEDRAALLRKDWHSFTATQITVPWPGGHDPEALAELTAALCHQSLAWDARTRLPVPLHVAGMIDRNHPEYRGPSFETEESQGDQDA